MVITNLNMVRGSTLSFDFSVTNTATGLAENLTGGTLKFTAKWDFTDVDGSAVFQKTIGSGITVTNAAGGLANVTIAASDTTSLPATIVNLNYDLKYTDASSNVWPILYGLLTIVPNVTVS